MARGQPCSPTLPELETASSFDLAVASILQPPKDIGPKRSLLGCYGICKPSKPEAVRRPPSANNAQHMKLASRKF